MSSRLIKLNIPAETNVLLLKKKKLNGPS